MKSILLKEIKTFFGSLVGYLVIGIFLIINGLFLWVFDGKYNVLQSGYNSLMPFFELSPWIFLILIPAVSMRTFSDEYKLGTIELLLTKPLDMRHIVFGKFLAVVVLSVVALLPTLVYILVLNPYGAPAYNIDLGSTIGSYLGILFLVFAYASIGVFSSSLTDNAIIAFIVSVALCFVVFIGFEELSILTQASFFSKLGMKYHYSSMSRGVIDTRDVVYFLSISTLFIYATILKIKKYRK